MALSSSLYTVCRSQSPAVPAFNWHYLTGIRYLAVVGHCYQQYRLTQATDLGLRMKYFTTAWWANGCENAEALSQQYGSYLASVRSRLPRELVAFDDEHTLHDSEVKSIV
jgi:hypothetical protein